jgi:hypothetical protein
LGTLCEEIHLFPVIHGHSMVSLFLVLSQVFFFHPPILRLPAVPIGVIFHSRGPVHTKRRGNIARPTPHSNLLHRLDSFHRSYIHAAPSTLIDYIDKTLR